MRFVKSLIFSLAIMASLDVAANPASAAPRMSEKDAFLLWVDVYGSPTDAIDTYGANFDADAYRGAMADEFVRAAYRDRIAGEIADQIEAVKLRNRFTWVSAAHRSHAAAYFGEYSFTEKRFPLSRPEASDHHSYRRPSASSMQVRPFSIDRAVNKDDFEWSISMPESRARAFLAEHPDRLLVLRITYSVMRDRTPVHFQYFFTTFIESVEVFADAAMTVKVATLQRHKGTPPTLADARAAVVTAADRLRTLLTPGNVLKGAQKQGGKDFPMRLTVTSFDAGTGDFSAETEWWDEKSNRYRPPSRANGTVAQDTLTFDVTVAYDESGRAKGKYTLRFSLRLDQAAGRLVGTSSTSAGSTEAYFLLK